ncbi:hypothetical protein RZN05_15670 [Sphingomonas sp. HF-S4]|uniref:Uncharacterized protein n=1 Tax=Sphingomonas agrestis TaxID=3080540 RepID=A0ABU3YAK6_9SPHN|nr:hypothetical protein [Sphingomonas sp. HF-S4]MDV3458436.1 hypothetical protein [Sphingomonas sp. HF-S4]
MRRRTAARNKQSRSNRSWVLRGGIAAIAIALGYLSITQSLGYAMAKGSPEKAYAIAPSDGRIGALLAYRLWAADGGPAQRDKAARIAWDSLVDEPLAVPAVATLAFDAELRGRSAEAKKLFVHSDALSRRELLTQLWLIEDAVRHDDVPLAIRHYDIALRTSPPAFDLLFPVLAGAVSDPAIFKVLVPTLARRPLWGEAFIRYLSTSGPDPRRTAHFFRLLVANRITVPEVDRAGVVNALVAANAFNDAWAYYQTLRSSADRRQSRDAEFEQQLDAPTAFDWTPRMSDFGLTATIQRTDKSGVFDFSAPSTVGGIVLEQLQLLPPGRYQLAGRSTVIGQTPQSAPYWVLICTDGRELGRVAVPNASQDNGRFAGAFTVDKSCPAQVLRLIVRPSSAVSGVSGQIEHVLLRPL